MRVILVRHAEAEPGSPDEERTLTPEGREAARALADRLGAERIDGVLTSPLLRARETAAPIAEVAGVEAEADERLAPGATADDHVRGGRRLGPHVIGIAPLAAHLRELRLERVHPLAHGREREPVHSVLSLVPAGTEAELDAAARDLLRGRRALRDHGRVPEGHGRDERPEPDPLRTGRERRQRRPCVERSGAAAADDREVVVGAEKTLEPRALGGLRERQPPFPGHALLALDHETDAHERTR